MNAAAAVADRLVAAGMSAKTAAAKAGLFDLAAAAHAARVSSGGVRAIRFFVPGRVEVLGKHTDYAGGRSLLCAAERGVCLIASPRSDRLLRIVDAAVGERLELSLDPEVGAARSDWEIYPATVARRIARNFPRTAGADIVFSSDLPRAAGLSSSSALVVGLVLGIAGVQDLFDSNEFRSAVAGPERLAEFLGCVENGSTFGSLIGDRGVGAFTGSEDQTALLCGRRGALSQYAFCPVRHERSVRLSEDWTLVVASSGVPSDKTGSARDRYNHLSLAAHAVLECWRRETGREDRTLLEAATSAPEAASQMRRILERSSRPDFSAADLRDRFGQFFAECVEIIPAAVDALEKNDYAKFGRLVDRSQSLAEELLRNQVPETIALARDALSGGAAAASAFGGGFGGSVWALVPSSESLAFLARWRRDYFGRFPHRESAASFFETRPGPAALRLDPEPRFISDLI
ncbi:MAG TPA: galactokinase family protein [Thermoanaerobaculia bacterium]